MAFALGASTPIGRRDAARAHLKQRLGVLCVIVLAACGTTPGDATHTASDGGLPHIAVDSNCEVLGPALVDRCHEFVQNNFRYVIPALADISGVALESCYPQIHYRFGATTSPGAGGQSDPDGTNLRTT